WTPVPGADGYELTMLKGDEMTAVATVPSSQLRYNFTGLSKDTTYWVSARAMIGGIRGRRATALSRRPDNGSCGHPESDGDLAVTALVSPAGSGRLLTGTVLTSSHPVSIRVKNLDNTASPSRAAQVSFR